MRTRLWSQVRIWSSVRSSVATSRLRNWRETLALNRLTTIVGAGGIGKTTVAVAAAQLFEDEGGGGSVTFVDFARVERPGQAYLSRAADLAHINSLLTTFAG